MDRHLEIALVSGALAIVWAVAFKLRVRDGHTQPTWLRITRRDNPGRYWSVMLMLWIVEAGFIGLAVVNVMAWL